MTVLDWQIHHQISTAAHQAVPEQRPTNDMQIRHESKTISDDTYTATLSLFSDSDFISFILLFYFIITVSWQIN